MTPQQFIAKWQRANLSERSACQQHFLDLCDLLGQPKPAEANPDGECYTFEYGVKKTGGGNGWADVWFRGHFGWEYKGKHKNLAEAYKQLLLYREDLENPPLLVVCDMDRFEVHTNFTGTAKEKHVFDLAGLADPANLDILRKLFTDPDALRPGITSEKLTVEAAQRFAELADGMRDRGIEPQSAAHFLMKLMFCMFGEKIDGLLPARLFGSLLQKAKANPAIFTPRLKALFAAMADGGAYGNDEIPWFNGGLFADADVIPLTVQEINTLAAVNEPDWASVEPSIFGTLFERTLDPSKRSQIGAHYTSRQDIQTLLVPVLLAPLRREWEEVKRRCEAELWPKVVATSKAKGGRATKKERERGRKLAGGPGAARTAFDRALLDYAERLAHATVLDPACGSGNFLYVALHMLLDLEKEVLAYAAAHGLNLLPRVNPEQLHGLEINPYAQQLAQVVIWIGYLQWMHHNGFKIPDHPVLASIENVRCMDAILDLSDPEHPREPEWPEAEFIVGNPPFLGNKQMRSLLGEEYVSVLWRHYGDRLPATSNLCAYWFEKAMAVIASRNNVRAGLLATATMKQVSSRKVLERIAENCSIFFAISERDWILDGASLRISMVGFGAKDQTGSPELDGKTVTAIGADLTSACRGESPKRLEVNSGLCFMGVTKVGDFDIDHEAALRLLLLPNPNGRPNSDVIRPFRNGSDLVRVCSERWIIDYGVSRSEADAARYEAPFQYLVEHVKDSRLANNRQGYRDRWWIHAEARPGLRRAAERGSRYLATARVAKHRLFVWLDTVVLPDSKLIAIALQDDYAAGALQSRPHEIWTNAVCGMHGGERRTYNPVTCFETFPFPEPTAEQQAAIAAAAKELDGLRTRWLNPAQWTRTEVLEFPGSLAGPWARYIDNVSGTLRVPPGECAGALPAGEVAATGVRKPASGTRPVTRERVPRCPVPDTMGIGTVRWPRLLPRDADCAASLRKRTLTNLYNERPAWLDLAHRKLDAAVFAAYGWDPDIADEELLERLLRLNRDRAGT